MEHEPEDQHIVDLLTRLKDSDGTYPKKMLASRRQVFLSQMASVGLGLGIGAGLKAVAKASKGGLSHSISGSSLLESILVLAIVAQAGIIAYSYRNQIADYVNTFSSSATATEISIPVTDSDVPAVVVSKTPTAPVTKTASPSPSSTVTAPSILSGDEDSDITTVHGADPTATPPANGNNGNHYGQTPRPTEPTNPDPPGGGGNGSGGNDNGNGNGKKP